MQIFSPEWSTELGKALNNSKEYQQQAQTWEGSLLLVLEQTNMPKEPAVWLDLWHGQCRLVRVAAPDDFDTADYILAANLNNWQQILAKDIAPIMAIMRGKLKLRKGSMATLARYTNAAKELVNVAANIPTQWSGFN